MDVESEINSIKERNKKVDLNKKWETSLERKLLVAALTYIVMALIFNSAQVPNPFFNALIPTLGFLLSTLTLDFAKQQWVKKES